MKCSYCGNKITAQQLLEGSGSLSEGYCSDRCRKLSRCHHVIQEQLKKEYGRIASNK